MMKTMGLAIALAIAANHAAGAADNMPADAAKKATEYCVKIAPSLTSQSSCLKMQQETYDKLNDMLNPGYRNGSVAYDPGDEARKGRLRGQRVEHDTAVIDLCPAPHKMTRDGCQ